MPHGWLSSNQTLTCVFFFHRGQLFSFSQWIKPILPDIFTFSWQRVLQSLEQAGHYTPSPMLARLWRYVWERNTSVLLKGFAS